MQGYQGDDGISYPNLPDFDQVPEYTAEGRPLALAAMEIFELVPAETDNCGCCKYFQRGTIGDPIGICMNVERQKHQFYEMEERG